MSKTENREFKLKDFAAILRTSGDGLWSSVEKEVKCTAADVLMMTWDNETWGELRVFFDPSTWDVNEDGLIYTDPGFKKGLHKTLKELGYKNVEDVFYSEQGMQGDDYVSLDIGAKFCANFGEENE